MAFCIFLQNNVIVNHVWHTSALQVNSQQFWISFETARHCAKIELHFLNKRLTEECTWFVCGSSRDLCTLWSCVLNNSESLTWVKMHSLIFKIFHNLASAQRNYKLNIFVFLFFSFSFSIRNVAHVSEGWIY